MQNEPSPLTKNLARVLKIAFEESSGRRESCTVAHLLRALLNDPDVRGALRAVGVQRSRLRKRLCDHLDSAAADNRELAMQEETSSSFKDALEKCAVQTVSSESPIVTGAHLFVAVFDSDHLPDEVLDILNEEGVHQADLKWYISHQMPREGGRGWGLGAWLGRVRGHRAKLDHDVDRPPDSTAGDVKVIMHNDPFTTRQFVVEVLTDVFEFSENDATELMLRVHNQGSALVAHLEADLAAAKVHRVRDAAAALGFPFRITFE